MEADAAQSKGGRRVREQKYEGCARRWPLMRVQSSAELGQLRGGHGRLTHDC